jgi:hypothetical protein
MTLFDRASERERESTSSWIGVVAIESMLLICFFLEKLHNYRAQLSAFNALSLRHKCRCTCRSVLFGFVSIICCWWLTVARLVEPDIPQYFAHTLGSQPRYDAKKPPAERGSISGEYGHEELSNVFESFIHEYRYEPTPKRV